MSAVIKLKDVSKRFGNKEIFRNVSLDIEEGSTVGFVGENGSGKSVLFQIIAGLIPVDSGTVTVMGELLGDKKDFPDSVGILINDPGYIEYYSGYKNLKLLAEIKNVISDEEIRKVMKMVGLDCNDRTPVRKYSMGMKQKLGIAQAFMENQQIVILDEPYNALDYKTNHDITDVIKQLKEEGRTVLLTSHQHEYLERLCDTIYCLHEKKIVPFTDELRKLYFSI
jgi:ABC-2 type transport system ATP-binding protein